MIKHWLEAARLRTLPLALSGCLVGASLANLENVFSIHIFIFCVLTALFLQVLSNFANDYGDTQNGADSKHRVGPSRAVQSGAISAQNMRKGIMLMAILSLFTGTYLLWLSKVFSHYSGFILLALGLVCIAAAIKYTAGKNPYGYKAMGDLAVFVFFGWVAVCGSYYLYAKGVSLNCFLIASSIGLWSTGVLNLNNMRDIESDKLANKNTIAIMLGFAKSKIYHSVLVLLGVLFAAIFVMLNFNQIYAIVLFAPLGLFIFHFIKVLRAKSNEIDPFLKPLALSTFVFSLSIFVVSFIN